MKKYFEAENLQLVFSGENYFQILEQLISESKETLHLQTYIFETDETALLVGESLKKAAKRGVEVFVLADAYGSFPFKKEIEIDLKQAGIHFRLYSPLFSSESIFFGRRLHHKIVVADKHTALVSGVNIANKYRGSDKEAAWLDYGVFIKGEVCEYLHVLCEAVYNRKRKSRLNSWENKKKIHVTSSNKQFIRFRRNDFMKQQNEIYRGYLDRIRKAEKSIMIVASYFLPGNNFRKLLRQAAKRGVDIKIILAGKSDVESVKLAQQYLYEFYLKNGIQLYEWQNSILHGKAMMVDNSWVTIGSYNLNFLSHYISIELNAEIIAPDFVRDFSSHLKTVIQEKSVQVNLERIRKNANYFGRLKMKTAYIFHRSIMNVVMLGRGPKK
jgi:cardiolipin synthase A/B